MRSDTIGYLRQDPLEAILVIFGRRALIFLFESSWKNMKNLCACAVVITLETQNVENGHLAPSNLTFFIDCDRQKRFSQNERRKG